MANMNATLFGSPTVYDNCIEFLSGWNDSYALVQNPITLGMSKNTKFTVEVRFSINDTSSYKGIISFRDTGAGQYSKLGFHVNSSSLYCGIREELNIANSANIAKIEANKAYTLAVVRDSEYYHVYLDGVLLVSYASAGEIDYNCKLYVGMGTGAYNGTLYALNGKVYAFRYYNGKALTQQEIESNLAVDRERFA